MVITLYFSLLISLALAKPVANEIEIEEWPVLIKSYSLSVGSVNVVYFL